MTLSISRAVREFWNGWKAIPRFAPTDDHFDIGAREKIATLRRLLDAERAALTRTTNELSAEREAHENTKHKWHEASDEWSKELDRATELQERLTALRSTRRPTMADQFYARDEDGRFETHSTETAARRNAGEMLDNCQENASDSGWPEGTGGIEWGRLVPLGECIASNERESDNPEFDYMIDYNLKDLPDPVAALQRDLEAAQMRVAELEVAVRKVVDNIPGCKCQSVEFDMCAHDLESLLTEKFKDV
jgi:uncharacterized protein YPO0396